MKINVFVGFWRFDHFLRLVAWSSRFNHTHINITHINHRSNGSCLTLMVGGLLVPALFSGSYFSMSNGVWRYQISWLFQIHYELGDLEGAGTFNSPHSSNNQKPPTIRVKINSYPAHQVLLSLVDLVLYRFVPRAGGKNFPWLGFLGLNLGCF